MRRSCSDSLLTASQVDGVVRSDRGSDIHRAAHSLIAREFFQIFLNFKKQRSLRDYGGVSEPTFSANYKDVIYADTKQEVEATASGLRAAQFPMAHHGAMTAINAELAALALMAEWAAFLSAR
jgi:hypothetical protein